MNPLLESDESDDESLGTTMNPPRVKLLQRRARPKRPTCRRFAPEGLEPRYLPSITLPGIVATDPADGATPLQAPQSFTITFDQSVVDEVDAFWADALSVPPDQVLPMIIAADTGQDVEIDRIAADGTATPVLGDNSHWLFDESIATATGPDGQPQTQLVVTPPAGSPALVPGTYQIGMSPQSDSILATAFATIEPDSAWASATQAIPIAQFTVLGQGPTLVEASDLGQIGPQPSSVQGYLDPGNYQQAVSLYRFYVPAGPLWQLDATVLANAIGSPAEPELTLFDSNGNVLATRTAGQGTAADSLDPELFTSLGQGTYYLGVSAAGNTPGFAYGYDPVTGRPGSAGVNEAAGRFVLDVSATPAVPSAKLVDFNLDHADTLEPAPTGLDLTFSSPVDISSLTQPDQQETALTVVDAAGQTWPITAVNYDASQDRLSLIFNEALPEGSYSLIVPSQGGLTDLSGRPVVGPDGSPAGVLASWNVSEFVGPSDQNNLGVLWPGPVNVTWSPGVSRSTALAAGQESDYRFVVTCPGFYDVETQPVSGSVDVQVQDSEGTTIAEADNVTQPNDLAMILTPGVYNLQINPAGSQPAAIAWTLRPVALDYEKLNENGVGQSPALSLPLDFAAAGDPAAPPNPEPTDGSSAMATVTSVASTSAGASPTATTASPIPTTTTASPIPTALLVSLETGLVGSPASEAGHTAAVGPLADGVSVALSDAGPGLPMGIRYQSSLSGMDPRVGEGDVISGPAAAPALARSGLAPVEDAAGPEAASARADASALALAQADPLVRIAGWFAGRFRGTASEPGEPDLPASELGTTLLASSAPAAGLSDAWGAEAPRSARYRRRDTLSQADLGGPCVLIVATALTYRLSDPVRRWWRRYHPAHALWPRPYGFGRGAAASGGEA
jgi:hypothetical protein